MSLTYTLETHLKHAHVKFAISQGSHYDDFPAHKHDFSEMFIVVQGSATHNVSNYHYPLAQGDVFVINGQVEHGFSDVDKLVLINLMFESQSPLFESSALKLLPGYQALFNIEPVARQSAEYTAKLNLSKQQYAEVERLIHAIDSEYNEASTGFETMLNAQLQQLIITLSRYYQGDHIKMNSSTMVLSRALVYLEEHFRREDLKTDQIAAASFVSVRQLERLFKRYLQTTPIQYLRKKRLFYAKEGLINYPTRSIQAIAEMTGFSDSNYFAKCFKQRFGTTPREYRTQYSRADVVT
jgi:AraC family L-rhamnose operon regulatory protein RhaS